MVVWRERSKVDQLVSWLVEMRVLQMEQMRAV